MLGSGYFKMTLLVSVTGGYPGLLGKSDEVQSRNMFWAFDHTMDVVTVRLVLFSDNEHGQLLPVSFEACAEDG